MATLDSKGKLITSTSVPTPDAPAEPKIDTDTASQPGITVKDNDLSQSVDTNIHDTIPAGNQVPDLDDAEIQRQLDDMFNAGPVNPKAVEFGAKEVEVGGRKLRMPSTVVNDSDFGSYTDEGFMKPIAAFKHHSVKRFNVGRHTFQNHILQIFTEDDLVDFLACWEGLQGPDKVNITQYDWEAAARVNTPVSDLISRGAMSTQKIKDPKQVA